MSQLNLAVIEGRITQDTELKYTLKGIPFLKFCVANNFRKKKSTNQDAAVNYFNVTAWDKLAELLSPYLKKGKHVIVSGRLEIRKYVSQQGENRTSVDIIANNIDFITSDFKKNPNQKAQRGIPY